VVTVSPKCDSITQGRTRAARSASWGAPWFARRADGQRLRDVGNEQSTSFHLALSGGCSLVANTHVPCGVPRRNAQVMPRVPGAIIKCSRRRLTFYIK
jgi:hypothetical protein